MIHPNKHLAGWQGVLQADAYSGYNDLLWLPPVMQEPSDIIGV
jgi:hypothetical protein